MSETHDDAPFAPNPEPIDGHFLVTEKRCPIKVAELNARLEALPEIPSQDYQLKSICMDLLRPTETQEEWRRMVRGIYEWRKHIVWMEGGETCKTTNLTNCLDQQSNMSSQPEAMTTI